MEAFYLTFNRNLTVTSPRAHSAACKGLAAVGLFLTVLFTLAMVSGSIVSHAESREYDAEALRYVLTVDGEAVGAAGSAEALEEALAEVSAAYVTGSTVSVSFEEEVAITEKHLSGAVTDTQAIADALSELVTVVTVDTERQFRTLPFETEYVYSDELYEGETACTQTGINGIACDLCTVTRENGETVSREEAGTETVRPAVNEVITVGTRAGSRTDSQGYYVWPAEGVISSYYGRRNDTVGSKNHKGIDIAGAYDDTITAADGGEVIYAQWAEGYGRFIKIRHDDGSVTCYGHLNDYLVSEGDRVAQGDAIGLMGSSGISSGAHLHFEVRPDGVTAANPLDYLP